MKLKIDENLGHHKVFHVYPREERWIEMQYGDYTFILDAYEAKLLVERLIKAANLKFCIKCACLYSALHMQDDTCKWCLDKARRFCCDETIKT